MSNSLAIQPIDLYGPASIRQVVLQSLLSATSANSASPLDSTSDVVQLSALGQVLGADATLQSSLEALQANTANATPSTVQTTAQAFVTAFNNVQQSIATALLSDNALVTQFVQTLNASGTSSTTAGKQDLSDLQAIGISFLSPSSTSSIETTARLSIDQSVLNAAAEANPAATATLLSDATQSLLQQVTTFEVQATSSTSLPTDTAVLGPGLPTELLQNLSADTVLNNIQLENLDLAAVGLDANTIRSESTVLDTSLAATTALANTIITTDLTAVADVKPVAVGAMPIAADKLATPDVATSETPAVTATTMTTTANQSLPQLPAVATVDTLSADQAAADATHALQVMMADSALRDVIFNPAYSALIASSHMSDFAVPIARTRMGAIPAEIPGAVLPINRIGAISSYQDAASAFVGR
ncbi:hypothetical protein [Propionivibrio sp.]|uniref:hypothetical protein n=1 Tax=Propionivibrio sp. TaxID=2212460 RepID=UPI0026116590|nr:hypothetical protein [Propionivibrio sp.]